MFLGDKSNSQDYRARTERPLWRPTSGGLTVHDPRVLCLGVIVCICVHLEHVFKVKMPSQQRKRGLAVIGRGWTNGMPESGLYSLMMCRGTAWPLTHAPDPHRTLLIYWSSIDWTRRVSKDPQCCSTEGFTALSLAVFFFFSLSLRKNMITRYI